MQFDKVQPEVTACAKQLVNLVMQSCENVKSEAEVNQNVGIIIGMLVQAIQHELDQITKTG